MNPTRPAQRRQSVETKPFRPGDEPTSTGMTDRRRGFVRIGEILGNRPGAEGPHSAVRPARRSKGDCRGVAGSLCTGLAKERGSADSARWMWMSAKSGWIERRDPTGSPGEIGPAGSDHRLGLVVQAGPEMRRGTSEDPHRIAGGEMRESQSSPSNSSTPSWTIWWALTASFPRAISRSVGREPGGISWRMRSAAVGRW